MVICFHICSFMTNTFGLLGTSSCFPGSRHAINTICINNYPIQTPEIIFTHIFGLVNIYEKPRLYQIYEWEKRLMHRNSVAC